MHEQKYRQIFIQFRMKKIIEWKYDFSSKRSILFLLFILKKKKIMSDRKEKKNIFFEF